MPSAPTGICRDCASRAVTGSKYCARHQSDNSSKQHKRLYDRHRADDPTRALYRCKRWQATRTRVLSRDILCMACGYRVATECDHILSARLVLDNFGIDEFYSADRCQGLCHDCHSSKTAMESGFTGSKGTKLESLGDRTNTTVVCGPAASGKSTYVATHKEDDDKVWDYDVVMAELTGLPMHESLPGAIGSVLAHRDQWIQATEHCKHHCWLIVSNQLSSVVQMMREAGATIIVMDTPNDVCKARLRARFIANNSL